MSLNKFTIQKSFAISAGAGSGKTYTLTKRYINAVLVFDFLGEKGLKIDIAVIGKLKICVENILNKYFIANILAIINKKTILGLIC